MPTVIGFLWPWAINTIFFLFFPTPPPQPRDPSSRTPRWSQSYETLASPHLHIYCIGLKSGEWLMWSLPPEFLAAYYYEREGGGCSTSVYFWLKLKRTELWVFPHLLFPFQLCSTSSGGSSSSASTPACYWCWQVICLQKPARIRLLRL